MMGESEWFASIWLFGMEFANLAVNAMGGRSSPGGPHLIQVQQFRCFSGLRFV